MKKSKKTNQKKKRTKAAPVAAAPARRRNLLQLAGFGGLVIAGFGGAGLWAVSSFDAHAAEHDLGRIGQGQFTVVQVHDPSCALCTELQRNTRRALRCDFAEEPVYLVASIRTPEGAAFSAQYGAPHVSLVVMDGLGEVQEVLTGVRPRDELKEVFESYFGRATA